MNKTVSIALLAAVVAAVGTMVGCGEQKPAAQGRCRCLRPDSRSRSATSGRSPAASRTSARTTRTARASRSKKRMPRASRSTARRSSSRCVAEDDQADPKVGTTVAQKLVDAKVAGVVGHLNSGTSIPASPIYNQAGIPVISGSATNPKLTEQGFKTQFRVVGRDDQQGPAVASYLAANNKPKLVAVIDDATAYGEGIANEVEKTLKAAGIKMLPREKGTDKTTDWKAILTKLRGRSPDAVFYGGMDATGGPLLKQGRELGMKAVFSFGDGACTDEMAKLAGPAAEGLLCSQAGIPAQAADKKFLEAYKKRFNADPILYSPFTYDAANLLIEAMQKANSADPAKYLPELQKIDFTGATGPIAFDDKGDRKDAEMTIFTMKGGKIEPIAVIKGGKTIAYAEFIKGGK